MGASIQRTSNLKSKEVKVLNPDYLIFEGESYSKLPELFQSIPVDIWKIIFSEIDDLKSILSIIQTCQSWNKIIPKIVIHSRRYAADDVLNHFKENYGKKPTECWPLERHSRLTETMNSFFEISFLIKEVDILSDEKMKTLETQTKFIETSFQIENGFKFLYSERMKLFNLWYSSKKSTLFLTGLQSSGKTTIFSKFIHQSIKVIPQGCSNIASCSFKITGRTKDIIIWDCSPFKDPSWVQIYDENHVSRLIFVVDCSDRESMENGTLYRTFHDTLGQACLGKIVLAVIANKQDKSLFDLKTLCSYLRLDAMFTCGWYSSISTKVFPCVATSIDNSRAPLAALSWLFSD